jgi:phosphatidate cytidylyltransferase
MLKERVITAIILLILFLAALFMLPGPGWSVLVAVMIMQGASEWTRLAEMRGRTAIFYWVVTLLLFMAMIWMSSNLTDKQQLLLQLLTYGLAVVFWVLLVPAWLMAGWKPRNPWLMGLAGWLVLLPTGLAMLDLRAENPWWLLGVMGLVWVADISAYFAGRKFGKNKLAPSISPGKTWEGVAGALLGVAVYVVLVILVSGTSRHYGLLPQAIVAAWWWTGLAIIGDLFESAVKRQAGVKDSGALLPGHGGLLDRIDALTPTLPLAALALVMQRLV